MIAQMFNETFVCLPTPEEILFGIILAQIEQILEITGINGDFSNFIKSTVQTWKTIFSLGLNMDLKKPLTTKILSDPNHEFV